MKYRHLIAMWFVGYASAMVNVGLGRDHAYPVIAEIAFAGLAVAVIYAVCFFNDKLNTT